MIKTAQRFLRRADPVMSNLIREYQPNFFTRRSRPHFHSIVKAIINQQLSLKAARTIEKRLLMQQTGRYFNADKLLRLKPVLLRKCGLSKNKIHYIHSVSQAVISKELNFRKLAKQDDEAVIESLVKFPGIGRWSAEMFLISSLGRPDIMPLGDLAIRRAIENHYSVSRDSPEHKYLEITDNWRPYRTVASRYLWSSASQ